MSRLQAAVDAILPATTAPAESGTGSAPANIALCKYWGKRDEDLKLPLTGSLSISLGSLGTRTTLTPSSTDLFLLNGCEQDPEQAATQRLFSFLDLFRDPDTSLRVESANSIPMAAGLASSASGFAALVLALNDLYQWHLPKNQLSILARLGSGSASRSLEHGFVEWFPGEVEDGSDSFAERLNTEWPEFRIGILTLSASKKSVGSSEGMKRTRETSTLFQSWPAEVGRALPRIREAIHQKDFPTLGAAAEQNALSMHATMIGSWPPILYWRPETVHTLHQVHALRTEGIEVYATLDAGPNVKLLFLENDQAAVHSHFPDLQIVAPFDARVPTG
jgi:diphosphomevalonate decarboxylase